MHHTLMVGAMVQEYMDLKMMVVVAIQYELHIYETHIDGGGDVRLLIMRVSVFVGYVEGQAHYARTAQHQWHLIELSVLDARILRSS